jgi:SSS family solute:Na+ symporter
MNITTFICLLFGLQLFYWAVGKRASKKIETNEDYFLAGKTVRLLPLTMTFLATQVGGGLVLGASNEAYRYGWAILLYPLGAALGLIFLGAGIGKKLAGFNVSTVAQIFEVVYKSANLKKIASVLSITSLFMVLVGQIIASSQFLVSIGFNNTPLFIAFWAIVIIYTAQGGLKAVISTDIVQASFFAIVFVVCFGLVAWSEPLAFQMPQLAESGFIGSKLCGWLLMPLMFMVIEQDMGQRCFAGKSPKIVSQATLLAGIGTLIICCVPVFFGVLARNLNLPIPEGASVLMIAIEKTTGPTISAIVGCAILAAVISTATSLISAISSNISTDFQKNSSLKSVQWITAGISVAAIVFAFYFDNVVDLLIQSYELSVSCLFVPIFIALFNKKGNALAAWISVLFGVAGFILFRMYPIAIPKEVASILLSLLGFGLGYLIKLFKRPSLQLVK